VSKGPTALRGAAAVLKLKGITAFFPGFYKEEAIVIGLKGEVSWPEVLKAFRKHVPEVRETE
jgi:hypothetical protein